MKMLTIAWLCGLGVGCGNHAERAKPAADKSAAAAAHGPRRRVVYELDVDKAVDDKAAELRRDLEAGLADASIVASVEVSAVVLGAVTVTPTDGTTRPAIEQLIKADYADVVEPRACESTAGPNAVCIAIAATYADVLRKTALGSAVETMHLRLVAMKVANPTVVEQDGQIVVEFPEDDVNGSAIRSLIQRTGTLEFKVVDDGSAYMKQVFAHVGSTGASDEATDARAIEEAITADVDQWRPEDGGASHTDYYLVAHDREALLSPERARRIGCPTNQLEQGQARCSVSGRAAIEAYLAELEATDPTHFKLPDDRQIGYQLNEPDPDAKDQRPYWRTYFLERAVQLTGAAIGNAEPSADPYSNRPLVLLEFNRAGARTFGDLTARIVGKKLAVIIDDKIASAPIINGPIRGGRASVTMGGNDPRRQEAERDELVNVLKTGSLPAPLREASSTVVP